MALKPIEAGEFELVAGGMADKANYQWLDFGNGSQQLTPMLLKIMTQKGDHVLRLFLAGAEPAPIGLVALSHLNRTFKTAMLWYGLGEKRYSGQGHATRAVSEMLALGFRELGLRAINAWVVENNAASRRLLERNRFRLIGRQRQCHTIDGRPYDRLLYDVLASGYKDL